MKKNSNYFLILFSFFLLMSCGSDDSPVNEPEVVSPQTKDISFSFDVAEISNKDAHKNKGVNETLLNKVIVDAASVVITIQDESNTIIYNREKLDLTKVNDTYISSSISLDFGNYTITEFIVLDAQDNAIYLTPKDGSDMAPNVTEALPISLTVGTSTDEQITFKVLDTNNLTAEDFGYVSFDYEILNNYSLGISVTIYNTETLDFELTEAEMILKGNGQEIFSETLEPSINNFSEINEFSTYTIEIKKDGYTDQIRELSIDQLKALGDNPYNIVLIDSEAKNSVVFISNQTEELKTLKYNIDGLVDYEYMIDWGDGVVDSYIGDLHLIEHDYLEQKEYTITITGNVNQIGSLFVNSSNISDVSGLENLQNLIQIIWDDNLFTELDLSDLPELKIANIANNQISSINISGLEKLQQLFLDGNQLSAIDVSDNTALTALVVMDNQLTEIDVTSNVELTSLLLSGNQLSVLDISANNLLNTLWLNNNSLTSIDISNNEKIYSLLIDNNEINEIEDMELIYNQLLTNVKNNNIVDGKMVSQDNVTASQAIIDIANELTNDYNWEVIY